MAKLEGIYTFITEDTGADDEFIITLQANNFQGEDLWLPLTTHDEKDVPKLSEIAYGIGRLIGKKVTLVKFNNRVDLTAKRPEENK